MIETSTSNFEKIHRRSNKFRRRDNKDYFRKQRTIEIRAARKAKLQMQKFI